MQHIRVSSFTLFIISCVVMALLFLITFLRLPPQIPLFYSLPLGNDQIADIWFIAIIPIISITFVSLNTFVSRRLLEGNSFTGDVARIANIVGIIGWTYVFIKIILLIA